MFFAGPVKLTSRVLHKAVFYLHLSAPESRSPGHLTAVLSPAQSKGVTPSPPTPTNRTGARGTSIAVGNFLS
jgi:hypothetical protein